MNLNSVKKLNNGVEIPILGLGVYQSHERTYDAVRYALDAGYRHIDTAAFYQNEHAVGKAIKDSGIPREKIFITTKLWNDDMRRHTVKEAFDNSLSLLDTDYIDMYLIHWPVKKEYISAYKIMEEIYSKGKIKAIGVCNFQTHHIDELLKHTEIVPVVNQIEFHPYFDNSNVFKHCKKFNIASESWSPLCKGKVLHDNIILDLATKYNKTASQIVIKWHIQKDIIVIPKSIHKQRIIQNANVFDFQLADEDIQKIDALNRDFRVGSHPDFFNF